MWSSVGAEAVEAGSAAARTREGTLRPRWPSRRGSASTFSSDLTMTSTRSVSVRLTSATEACGSPDCDWLAGRRWGSGSRPGLGESRLVRGRIEGSRL